MGFVSVWPWLAKLAGEMAVLIGLGDVGAIARLTFIVVLVFLFQKLMQFGQDSLMAKGALDIALNLRRSTYRHLQRLSLDYFNHTQTGDLSYRLTEDIDRIGEVVNKFFHDFIPSSLQLLVLLGYMVYLNWQLTLSTLIIAPLITLLIGWFGERMRGISLKSQSQSSELSALMIEVFNGIRLVQAFAAEDYTTDRFSREAIRHRQSKYRLEQLKAVQFPVVGFLEAVSFLVLLLLGGWQISLNNLTAAGFVSYITAVALLIDPIGHLTSNYNEFKQGEASIDRIFELLALRPTVWEDPAAKPLPPITGHLEFRHLSFGYQLDQLIFQDFNLVVAPGEMVALVGSSGAGKTSLVNLIPRFYDPYAGAVLIDGVDIRHVTLQSLRQQIGIVPQETILFSGTIAQNIAFGQSQFDLSAVQWAAEAANAHQFISSLPQGYDTWVGERGVNLSGGQRQRLAIARAVLLNPRILILDEATSSLDSESEVLVQQALERLMKNRTVLIIAHRLATVRRSDRILVMERGEIIESGTHHQLLVSGGRYASFYARQWGNDSLSQPN